MNAQAGELLQAAIEMEEAGIDFYRALALNSSDVSVKRFCHETADDEARHRQRFARLREELSIVMQDRDDHRIAQVARNLVLPDRAAVQRVAQGELKAAVRMAIEMEEASLRYYRQLCELFPEQAPLLEEIIREEASHLNLLKCMPF